MFGFLVWKGGRAWSTGRVTAGLRVWGGGEKEFAWLSYHIPDLLGYVPGLVFYPNL